MRIAIRVVGVLGLGASVTAALAQSPVQRRASLLPPQPLDATEVARAAAPEPEPALGSTPVTRRPGGPAWLGGTDAGIRHAAATGPNPHQVRQLTPRDEPPLASKGLDKPKNPFGPSGPSAPQPGGSAAPRETANANTPYRGTGANGQPVFAGPPAYRWYGWGSVTPGANPHAPGGQYPRASANWFTITGATPGAFPVPVTGQGQYPAGTEPPAYVNPAAPPPARPTPVSFSPAPAEQPPTAPPGPHGGRPRLNPPPEAPLPTSPPSAPPPPVAVPTLTPPPVVTVPVASGPESPATRLPGVGDPAAPLPPPVVVPSESVAPPPVRPAPLPPSVTEEPPRAPQNPSPPPADEWSPAGAPRPQTGATDTGRPRTVVRGQAPADDRPEPAGLIRKLCDGRATGIDVRVTGAKTLAVSFECRTAADARRLVADISARPELAPYQIDFSVAVK